MVLIFTVQEKLCLHIIPHREAETTIPNLRPEVRQRAKEPVSKSQNKPTTKCSLRYQGT